MRDGVPAPGPSAGAIVPHAPLLLPAVGARVAHPDVAQVREAASTLNPEGADVVVVLSPHGPRAAVYGRCWGDLSGFGVNGVTIERESDSAAAKQLASDWNVPVLDGPVDHGVLVPLKLLGLSDVPVIAACLAETGAPLRDEVDHFVEAVGELGRTRHVFFVASANTSAGLSPRAPLTELPGASEVEAKLRSALERDPGDLDGLAAKLAEVGGSCSRGPLTAFGALFAGRPARVLAHVSPFGVGYMVATVGTRARA